MSLTVPVVRAWRLETVAAQVGLLREDARVFDETATAVRHGRDRQLDGLEGDTVAASTRGCGELSRDLGVLANKAESLIAALDAFHKEATVHRTKLLTLVESAGLKGFAVNDDGSLIPPIVTGVPDDPAVASERARIEEEGTALHEDITAELRTLERIDVDAGNALKLMVMEESFDHHPYSDRSDNGDPRSAIAGLVITAKTEGLSAAIKEFGESGGKLVRGLGPFGSALGLTAGVEGASEAEPRAETLAAEGAGALAAGGVAAAGGKILALTLAGSAVPGLGNAAGLILGTGLVVASAAAGYGTSHVVREHFDDMHEQGKDPFS